MATQALLKACAQGQEKRGRPTRYSQKLALVICQRLSDGESLNAICKSPDVPVERTLRSWDPQRPFSSNYARAREVGYLKMADELLEIVDDSTNDFVDRQAKSGRTIRVSSGGRRAGRTKADQESASGP